MLEDLRKQAWVLYNLNPAFLIGWSFGDTSRVSGERHVVIVRKMGDGLPEGYIRGDCDICGEDMVTELLPSLIKEAEEIRERTDGM